MTAIISYFCLLRDITFYSYFFGFTMTYRVFLTLILFSLRLTFRLSLNEIYLNNATQELTCSERTCNSVECRPVPRVVDGATPRCGGIIEFYFRNILPLAGGLGDAKTLRFSIRTPREV